jgi:hypothetical protein
MVQRHLKNMMSLFCPFFFYSFVYNASIPMAIFDQPPAAITIFNKIFLLSGINFIFNNFDN